MLDLFCGVSPHTPNWGGEPRNSRRPERVQGCTVERTQVIDSIVAVVESAAQVARFSEKRLRSGGACQAGVSSY